MRNSTRHFPVLTAAALVVISVFFLLQLARPEILSLLRRDLPALLAGEWWRLATPLLVQAAGLSQFALNALGLAVVGAAVERKCGRLWWTILVIAGGLAGEIAGYAWNPTGAGSSFAVCGLAGGLTMVGWRRRPGGERFLHFAWYWITALTGLSLFGPAIAVAFCAGLAGLEAVHRTGRLSAGQLTAIASFAIVLQALVLTGLADSHGPALLAGIVLGLAVRPPAPRRTG